MLKHQKQPTRSTAIGFRAPPDLTAWLKEQAAANKRSLSNQAVWALDQYRLAQQPKRVAQ